LSFFSSGVLPNQVVRSSVTTALKTDLTWGVNRYRMSMTEMKRLEMVACRGLKTNSRAEKPMVKSLAQFLQRQKAVPIKYAR